MHAINNVFEQIELCEPRLYQIYQELVDSDKLKAIEEKYIDLVEENEQLKEKVKELQKFRNKFKTNFRTVFP
jgi:regulator of replication initiation timing